MFYCLKNTTNKSWTTQFRLAFQYGRNIAFRLEVIKLIKTWSSVNVCVKKFNILVFSAAAASLAQLNE